MDTHSAVAMSHIENHFFLNDAFLLAQRQLENLDAIAEIPGVIVHGRYDMICPLDNAQYLHERWPASELLVVREAGHSAFEPGITDALIKATEEIAVLLARQFNGEGA